MGEAIAHFQCGVATLQWCHDSKGHDVHGKRVARTINDLHARERASLGRPVTTSLLGHSVAIENSLSRQRRLTLCHDRVLGS